VKRTGLNSDALRAWERRYGLPKPSRSEGPLRLHSQHNVATLKWLTAHQREGLSIKQAVQMWRQIEDQGRDPLQAAVPTATQTTTTPQAIPEANQQAQDRFQECQSLFESHGTRTLGSAGIRHRHLALTNRKLGLNISAVPVLGDMEFLGANIGWVLGLLSSFQLPPKSLYDFLWANPHAIRIQVGPSGRPIVAWLTELTSKCAP
jgi:DNA-binding transcriptional MerR regulator